MLCTQFRKMGARIIFGLPVARSGKGFAGCSLLEEQPGDGQLRSPG